MNAILRDELIIIGGGMMVIYGAVIAHQLESWWRNR